jgi:hypothetical protein
VPGERSTATGKAVKKGQRFNSAHRLQEFSLRSNYLATPAANRLAAFFLTVPDFVPTRFSETGSPSFNLGEHFAYCLLFRVDILLSDRDARMPGDPRQRKYIPSRGLNVSSG